MTRRQRRAVNELRTPAVAKESVAKVFQDFKPSRRLREANEAHRLAFVPQSKGTVSLPFIKKVNGISVPVRRPEGDWCDVSFDLEVDGVGTWKGTVPIFIKRKEEPTQTE